MENNNINNIQEPRFHGTANFPQPIVVGFGSITSAGAKNDSEIFHPQTWTVTKTSTGVYRITHNIGHKRYTVQLTVVNAGVHSFINLTNKADNSFDVYTGQLIPTAYDDRAFEFTVLLNM